MSRDGESKTSGSQESHHDVRCMVRRSHGNTRRIEAGEHPVVALKGAIKKAKKRQKKAKIGKKLRKQNKSPKDYIDV